MDVLVCGFLWGIVARYPPARHQAKSIHQSCLTHIQTPQRVLIPHATPHIQHPQPYTYDHTQRVLREDLFLPLLLAALLLLGAHAFATDVRRMIISPLVCMYGFVFVYMCVRVCVYVYVYSASIHTYNPTKTSLNPQTQPINRTASSPWSKNSRSTRWVTWLGMPPAAAGAGPGGRGKGAGVGQRRAVAAWVRCLSLHCTYMHHIHTPEPPPHTHTHIIHTHACTGSGGRGKGEGEGFEGGYGRYETTLIGTSIGKISRAWFLVFGGVIVLYIGCVLLLCDVVRF